MEKLTLKLESLNKKILALYARFLVKILSVNNNPTTTVHLPSKKKRLTFLKSPHVFKKSKEHFELKKNKTIIICHLNIEKLKILLLNRPNTIKIKITCEKRR